jgi:hypothetical protein
LQNKLRGKLCLLSSSPLAKIGLGEAFRHRLKIRAQDDLFAVLSVAAFLNASLSGDGLTPDEMLMVCLNSWRESKGMKSALTELRKRICSKKLRIF